MKQFVLPPFECIINPHTDYIHYDGDYVFGIQLLPEDNFHSKGDVELFRNKLNKAIKANPDMLFPDKKQAEIKFEIDGIMHQVTLCMDVLVVSDSGDINDPHNKLIKPKSKTVVVEKRGNNYICILQVNLSDFLSQS